jgi:HlyD family secretion protein
MLKVLPREHGDDGEPAASAMDRPIRARRLTPARLALAAVVLLAVAVGAFAYVKFGLVHAASVSAERLTLSTVRTGLFRDYVPATGAVVPRETIFLDSVEGGQVVSVLVEEGVHVRAGQPLVKLANTRLQLEVVGREAQFNEQRNNLETLQLAFTQNELQHRRAVEEADYNLERVGAQIARYRPLVEQGFYPKAALQDLERELAYYRAQRATRVEAQAADHQRMERQLSELRGASDRLTGSLSLIRGSLDNLTVTAPIDGQLTVLKVQPGQAVGPGQRIGQVDRIDSYKVTVLIDEFYLGRIIAGQTAVAVLEGRDIPLKVAKVYPDVRERRFQADLDFAGPAPPSIRPGQSLQLRIELGEAPHSLIVGNGAFYEDTGGQWAFVLAPDGASAHRRPVRLGRRNPEAIEVLSGLQPGETIVTSAYQTFKDVERLDIAGSRKSQKGARP